MRWLIALVAVAGCSTVLGIDGEVKDRDPASAGTTSATQGGGPSAGGSGGAAGVAGGGGASRGGGGSGGNVGGGAAGGGGEGGGCAPMPTSYTAPAFYWDFDSVANNLVSPSAGPVSGAISGMTTQTPGVVDQALVLDGDDYVDFGNANALDWVFSGGGMTPKRTTISMWIQTSSSTGEGQALLSRWADDGCSGAGSSRTFTTGLHPGGEPAFASSTPHASSMCEVSYPLAVGSNWRHLVFTYFNDGTGANFLKYEIYVDAVKLSLNPAGDCNSGFESILTNSRVAFGQLVGPNGGACPNSSLDFFVGNVDELAVFGDVLAQEAISELYERGMGACRVWP